MEKPVPSQQPIAGKTPRQLPDNVRAALDRFALLHPQASVRPGKEKPVSVEPGESPVTEAIQPKRGVRAKEMVRAPEPINPEDRLIKPPSVHPTDVPPRYLSVGIDGEVTDD